MFHFWIESITVLRLVVIGIYSIDYFCHASAVLRSMMLRVSVDVISFNYKVFWGKETPFAIISAFSLPNGGGDPHL